MSQALEFFGDMTSDGVTIVGRLLFIKPAQTVLYHVGNLPGDRSNPTDAYRMGEVKAKEVDNIVAVAEAVAAKGQCQLVSKPICDDVTAYYAVGVDA